MLFRMAIGDVRSTIRIGLDLGIEAATGNHTDDLANHLPGLASLPDIKVDFDIELSMAILSQHPRHVGGEL